LGTLVLINAMRLKTRTSTIVLARGGTRKDVSRTSEASREDRAQKLFFRRHRLSPFGLSCRRECRRLDLGADINDPASSRFFKPLPTHSEYRGDFSDELRVARHTSNSSM